MSSEIRVECFADSVSSTAVQLRRKAIVSPSPDSNTGMQPQQVNLIMRGTADTAFWQTNCQSYEVIIRRKT